MAKRERSERVRLTDRERARLALALIQSASGDVAAFLPDGALRTDNEAAFLAAAAADRRAAEDRDHADLENGCATCGAAWNESCRPSCEARPSWPPPERVPGQAKREEERMGAALRRAARGGAL